MKTPSKTIHSILTILTLLLVLQAQAQDNWCDRPPRKGYENLKEVNTGRPWFKVYAVADNVYAIFEPYNWQSVISYLIVGQKKAILFDSGMGLDSIQAVVKHLTKLPVSVINSHTHYDHIGGNADFDSIYGVDTAYTREHAKNGWPHDMLSQEVTTRSFCMEKLPHADTAGYVVRPYKITGTLRDGMVFDLGGRRIEAMNIPGHTPDCVALLDRDAGLLWTGDTYYEGPIWLFFPGTDLNAFQHTITRLAELTPKLKYLLPAHNLPLIDPQRLVEVRDGLAQVRAGKHPGEPIKEAANPLANNVWEYKFTGFSFLIRKDLL